MEVTTNKANIDEVQAAWIAHRYKLSCSPGWTIAWFLIPVPTAERASLELSSGLVRSQHFQTPSRCSRAERSDAQSTSGSCITPPTTLFRRLSRFSAYPARGGLSSVALFHPFACVPFVFDVTHYACSPLLHVFRKTSAALSSQSNPSIVSSYSEPYHNFSS
jgi:hypothetical protein